MLQALEFLAVVAAAAFGVLLARTKGMDVVGVCCVAFLIAFGGGTLRDVLLDRRPLFWVEYEHYAWIVFGIALLGAFVPRLPRRLERWLDLPDALGLALYSVVGAGVALDTEDFPPSPFLASLFGVITGTFGGVLADVVVNDVPRLFQPTLPLYAICSFAGCWVYLLLRHTAVGEDVALWTGAATVTALRLAALRWNLRLPAAGRRDG